ncbi:hypothetical protein OXX80_004000 [Metschnikowia pulcherrima]
MSLFEELDAELGSLSLGGLSEAPQTLCYEDDQMEIDSESMESFDLSTGATLKSKESTDDVIRGQRGSVHEEDDEGEHNDSSFLHNLSPTVLGAKYAMKPMKLLMPPPTATRDVDDTHTSSSPNILHSSPDYDYEFDTSSSTGVEKAKDSSVITQRTFGGFGPMGQGHGLPHRAAPFVSVTESEDLVYENTMGMFRSLQRNLDPVQIHHHHYYPPTTDLATLKKENRLSNYQQPPDQNVMSHSTYDQSKAGMGMGMGMIKRDQDNSVQNSQKAHQMHLTSTGASSEMLPSPWDSRAMPAERTPYVLSSYLQLLINVVLSGYFLHIVIAMVQAIRQDVAHKLKQEANNLLVEIASCERSYNENHCSPETIVPALEKMCAYWEKCMNQDPYQVGNRSSISAHTIGVILNSLIEPLSFKVLAVGAAATFVIFACNFAFGYIRAKTYYGWTSAHARRV